ncbi:hypothetical protein Pmar_PMAR022047 [Perkinsus marinus ATCC 50983]|uniref:Uncharacterized protein n=1 Tax=Perkinsus marinus (strain ATCC 50983 / TXsc) TaxID=423536 RepID=C5K999_PERM5|nr:hypothetical protein Pmar_PMAR022047 [Perkinsus marinus ATCC 50983]EER18940.1 hypothetical protein Pmar_PMAR022047 [Perkinsus marinus ATCC 50983]|eukprot:XP_002787144.1 hypothetical protein Pmar_PMAR022047 [Perkinsus marinus ATCC 50983]
MKDELGSRRRQLRKGLCSVEDVKNRYYHEGMEGQEEASLRKLIRLMEGFSVKDVDDFMNTFDDYKAPGPD